MAIKDIEKNMDDFFRKVEEQISVVNEYAGETFVREARQTNTYQDDTGNLRNSTGYTAVKDGDIVNQSFPGGGEGAKKGKEVSYDLVKHIALGMCAVAGMSYALAVETGGKTRKKGVMRQAHDVISMSVEKVKPLHQRMMKNVLSKIAE